MKAKFFAVALLSAISSFPLHAANDQSPPLKPLAQIELNQADASDLEGAVRGIGQKRAQAIIKYRSEHGQFKSIEELAKVPGFSELFVQKHFKELEQVFHIKSA